MKHIETTILDKARHLGVALPAFRMIVAPQRFAAWADRVAWADSRRHAGQLDPADLDECDRQLGLPALRARREPQPLELSDVLAGIAGIIAAFGETARPA